MAMALVFAVDGRGVLTESGNTGYIALRLFVLLSSTILRTAALFQIADAMFFYFIIRTSRWFAYLHCGLGPPDLEVLGK
jgi:hypothetical protein